MPESDQHQRLIQRIVDYVSVNFASTYSLTIVDDLPKPIGAERPPAIGRYRPDVYALDVPETIVIIGEAKTFKDLENEHSRDQYRSFLAFLSERQNGYFILALPFQYVPAARRIISNIILKMDGGASDVKVMILDEIGERLL